MEPRGSDRSLGSVRCEVSQSQSSQSFRPRAPLPCRNHSQVVRSFSPTLGLLCKRIFTLRMQCLSHAHRHDRKWSPVGMIFVTPPEDSHRRSLGIRELYMTHSKRKRPVQSLGFRVWTRGPLCLLARVLLAGLLYTRLLEFLRSGWSQGPLAMTSVDHWA